jgi:hypothetical protein
MDSLEKYARFKYGVTMSLKEEVIDFIINEFGDYNPTFQDILEELGMSKEDLSEQEILLIQNKVG